MTTEADKQKARECAVEVLRNCASHYATPGRYITSGAEQPQKFINIAIDNATPIVAAYGRQRYREGLEAALVIEEKHYMPSEIFEDIRALLAELDREEAQRG